MDPRPGPPWSYEDAQQALKALEGPEASARLAAARTMSFTAVVSYESPSVFGPSPETSITCRTAASVRHLAGHHLPCAWRRSSTRIEPIATRSLLIGI